MNSLFSAKTREHAVPSRLVVDYFRWLDESPRQCAEAARQLCNDMFARYPSLASDREQARNELRGRFRDNNNSGHYSAFWELLLHEVFLRLGYQVEVHPDVDGKNPDFHITTTAGESVIVEAACLLPELESDQSAMRRLEEVFVALNDYPKYPEFRFMVSYNGAPTTPVPKQNLYQELDRYISGTATTTVPDDNDDEQTLMFLHDDWQLRIALFPIKGRSTYQSRIASRGNLEAYCMRAFERAKFRADEKARAYGKAPIVIAINVNEHFVDNNDIATLLYGPLCASFSVSANNDEPTEAFRGTDGLFIRKQKPTNLNVIGVLLSNSNPWNLHRQIITFHFNPFNDLAKNGFVGPLVPLHRLPHSAVNDECRQVHTDGDDIRTILELPREWPNCECCPRT